MNMVLKVNKVLNIEVGKVTNNNNNVRNTNYEVALIF